MCVCTNVYRCIKYCELEKHFFLNYMFQSLQYIHKSIDIDRDIDIIAISFQKHAQHIMLFNLTFNRFILCITPISRLCFCLLFFYFISFIYCILPTNAQTINMKSGKFKIFQKPCFIYSIKLEMHSIFFISIIISNNFNIPKYLLTFHFI